MKTNLLDDSPEQQKDERRDEEVLFASLSNPSVFGQLIERYQAPFRNKVRSILGEREEIGDIIQVTFVKIYLNGRRYQVQEGASFKSWGYKILLNTTFTFYQKLKKDDGALVRVEQELYESFPDLKPPERETMDLVASVLTRMPKQLAKALKLHFLDGMPQKEIAILEGVSISAIKTRIHRAKKEYKKISGDIN